MTNRELQQLVEDISQTAFSRPFQHQANFNARLKTTGGRYLTRTHCLEFNPHIADRLSRTDFIAVIKHELCHYHLDCQHMPCNHRSLAFKQLLATVDGSRFVPAYGLADDEIKHHYQCQKCAHIYTRRRRVDKIKYRCRCGGKLTQLD